MKDILFRWQTARTYILVGIFVICLFFVLRASAHVDFIEPGLGIELYRDDFQKMSDNYVERCHEYCKNPNHQIDRDTNRENESKLSTERDCAE